MLGAKVDLNINPWHWFLLIGLLGSLLLIDILVVHRTAHVVKPKEAAIETVAWVSIGLLFGAWIAYEFGKHAAGEYISGYLIEESLSIDNVFVWAVLFSHFKVPPQYQHRVLFWGIFGAFIMRLGFIFAGVAIIDTFKISLIVFGLFLAYTGVRLLRSGDEEFDPQKSKILRAFHRVVPSTDVLDGQKLFTVVNAKRLATPLLAVLVMVELSDIIFAVDSVPAVLSVTKEQYVAFASNAFAIMGLRALYFLVAGMRDRFQYLQTGLGVILVFVGAKMVWSYSDHHLPIGLSLAVIVLVLAGSVFASIKWGTPPTNEDTPKH
ncbi:MAG: TerC family protein [Ilumatobacteraceae bacterium]|nr:TerC family protein [Ilumatobacteraceae bacterium]